MYMYSVMQYSVMQSSGMKLGFLGLKSQYWSSSTPSPISEARQLGYQHKYGEWGTRSIILKSDVVTIIVREVYHSTVACAVLTAGLSMDGVISEGVRGVAGVRGVDTLAWD
jgi:hypothetical protein